MTIHYAASSQMGSKQALNSMQKLAYVKNFHLLYFFPKEKLITGSISNISGCRRTEPDLKMMSAGVPTRKVEQCHIGVLWFFFSADFIM
jgi:hypothetical protein